MTGSEVLATAAFHAGRLAYLADDTDVGDEKHKAGPIAIVVIAVLCIVCFFLFRSMSKHLRRVRENAEAQQRDDAGGSVSGETPADASTPADAPPVVGAARAAPKSRTRPEDPPPVP